MAVASQNLPVTGILSGFPACCLESARIEAENFYLNFQGGSAELSFPHSKLPGEKTSKLFKRVFCRKGAGALNLRNRA
jgi:hypothetical protein